MWEVITSFFDIHEARRAVGSPRDGLISHCELPYGC